MADRIAAACYVALVSEPVPSQRASPGRRPDRSDEAGEPPEDSRDPGPFFATLTPSASISDVGNYLDFLSAQDDVAAGLLGVTSCCMGGTSSRSGLPVPTVTKSAQTRAFTAATSPAMPRPVRISSPVNITATLYIAHADNDPSTPPDQIEWLSSALDAAGVDYRAELFAGAAHGFTRSDSAAYNNAAEDRTGSNWWACSTAGCGSETRLRSRSRRG